MEFKITLTNGKELKDTFRRAPGIANREFGHSLERIAAYVTREAKQESPVGNYQGGGNLRQRIMYQRFNSVSYLVTVNSLYGAYVEFGTKPHVITPRNKPFLAFKTKSGNWVRTKRVNHPGTKAQPFFSTAITRANTYANEEMDRAIQRVINQL